MQVLAGLIKRFDPKVQVFNVGDVKLGTSRLTNKLKRGKLRKKEDHFRLLVYIA